MAKNISVLQMAGINISSNSELPLYQQLYKSLQKAILEGRLRPGYRLPATRIFAQDLGVSRNTVVNAFEQLLAEGYIKSEVGSGTFISDCLPESLLKIEFKKNKIEKPFTIKPRELSKIGKNIKNILISPNNFNNENKPFRHGIPALEFFPFKTWEKISSNIINKLPINLFGYNDPAGYKPLREAIAYYLRTSRAVKCETEQIIIVSGSQQALDLTSRVLLDPGDSVLIEDPGYPGAKGAFMLTGINPVPVQVDSEGIKFNDKGLFSKAKLVYVTPSHQYPLGYIMSISRRLQLLEWAENNNSWILEDDYDSEFRYTGMPLPSLQGLDLNKRVIYTGSFSKVLFPALRLGYLVVPADLVEQFTAMRALTDRGNPILEQAVTASFIEGGHFHRHIRRMRHLYFERQQILVDEVNKQIKGLLKISLSDAGMHLIGWLNENSSDKVVSLLLMKYGIIAPAISNYSILNNLNSGLILGYTAYNENEIRLGVKNLAVTLDLYYKSTGS